MTKRFLSFLLCALMLMSVVVPAAAQDNAGEPEPAAIAKPYTVTKISNPDRGEREVDGLIEGGDRENSYTWRLAMRGDEIYIATTRNIASALVNMYAGAFAEAGISLDTFWALIDVVTNGDIPRNDANEGANIISYNRSTGKFKVIYTADTGDYFRMAVTFGEDVYFGSYSAVPTNPQYILKLDTDGSFTKVFQTMGSVSLRANCVYDDHLFFAGADDREVVPEGEEASVAKMAALRKSNEDDTVWERVADYRDFGATTFDPIHTSWAGASIGDMAADDENLVPTGASTELAEVSAIIRLMPEEYLASLTETAQQLLEKYPVESVKNMISEKLKAALREVVSKLAQTAEELYQKIDGDGIAMYLYINKTV